jgi:hypothetical protein
VSYRASADTNRATNSTSLVCGTLTRTPLGSETSMHVGGALGTATSTKLSFGWLSRLRQVYNL